MNIQSVCIPENWKKSNNDRMDFLNWMAFKVKSVHYSKIEEVIESKFKNQ
jgi:hypothetical protein